MKLRYVGLLAGLIVPAVGLVASCTKEQGTIIAQGLTPIEKCEAQVLTSMTWIEDPLNLVSQCAGATIESLVSIGEKLIADALIPWVDGGTLSDATVSPTSRTRLAPEVIAHIQRSVVNLKVYRADGGLPPLVREPSRPLFASGTQYGTCGPAQNLCGVWTCNPTGSNYCSPSYTNCIDGDAGTCEGGILCNASVGCCDIFSAQVPPPSILNGGVVCVSEAGPGNSGFVPFCINILNDPANCGSCGVQCPPGVFCLNGYCQ